MNNRIGTCWFPHRNTTAAYLPSNLSRWKAHSTHLRALPTWC